MRKVRPRPRPRPRLRDRRASTPGRAGSAGAGDGDRCPVHASIQVLQEKWTLHIVRALLRDGALGFNELRRAIGCNPATLTQRLERLEALGVVTRTVHSVAPPRTSYALTRAGAALRGVITAIANWAAAYLGDAPRSTARNNSERERRQRPRVNAD